MSRTAVTSFMARGQRANSYCNGVAVPQAGSSWHLSWHSRDNAALKSWCYEPRMGAFSSSETFCVPKKLLPQHGQVRGFAGSELLRPAFYKLVSICLVFDATKGRTVAGTRLAADRCAHAAVTNSQHTHLLLWSYPKHEYHTPIHTSNSATRWWKVLRFLR